MSSLLSSLGPIDRAMSYDEYGTGKSGGEFIVVKKREAFRTLKRISIARWFSAVFRVALSTSLLA